MTITYQQAKRIRKTGFLDLISDQLMYERKVSTAIGQAISLKTRGTIKGITQHFDPLNIARMMTFGSSIGPALLGHLTGRDARDIQYFSKRYKPIREQKRTGEKLTKLGRGADGGDLDIASSLVLRKIHTLLANSYEMDKTRMELVKNREEEHELENDKKHKELLEALKGRTTLVRVGLGSEKESDGGMRSWIEKLMDFMKTVGVLFMGVKTLIQNSIGTVMKWVLGRLGSVTKMFLTLMGKMGKYLFSFIRTVGSLVLRIFRHPAFLAAMGTAAAAEALIAFHNSLMVKQAKMNRINAELIDEYRNLDILRKKYPQGDKSIDQTEKNIADLDWNKSDLEAEINTAKNNNTASPIEDMIGSLGSMWNDFNADSLDFTKVDLSGFEKVPNVQVGDNFSDLKMDNDTWDWQSSIKNMFGNTNKFDRQKSDSAAIESGRSAQGELQRLPDKAENITSPAMPATAVEMPSIDNNDTKMQNKMPNTSLIGPNLKETNQTNIMQSSKSIPVKKPLPSVRNPEDTFRRLIYNSTRVV